MDPEAFHQLRALAGLNWASCAAALGVSSRAVRYWEAGQRPIPYAAFRLLRVLAGRGLPWRGWEDFMVAGGDLISPEGHRFSRGDLSYLSLTFRQAAAFREAYAALSELRQKSVLQREKTGVCTVSVLCTSLGAGRSDAARFARLRPLPRHLNEAPRDFHRLHVRPFGSSPQPDTTGPGPRLAPGARRAAAYPYAVLRPYAWQKGG